MSTNKPNMKCKKSKIVFAEPCVVHTSHSQVEMEGMG